MQIWGVEGWGCLCVVSTDGSRIKTPGEIDEKQKVINDNRDRNLRTNECITDMFMTIYKRLDYGNDSDWVMMQ
jgi:hypothetical protein